LKPGGSTIPRARSPRERNPQLVGAALKAAKTLRDRGKEGDAGWLALALVESELRRPGILAEQAASLACHAASQLANAGALRAAVEVCLAAEAAGQAAQALRREGYGALAQRLETRPARQRLGERVPGLASLGKQPSAADPGTVRRATLRALSRFASSVGIIRALPLYDGLDAALEGALAAQAAGQHAEAAQRLQAAGRPMQAAMTWLAARQDPLALESLFLVSHKHPSYRQACVLAAGVATREDDLRFELDHLLGPFLAAPPRTRPEAKAFVRLARLYARHDRKRSAAEIIQALHASFPRSTEALRNELDLGAWKREAQADERIMAEDAAAHGRNYGSAPMELGSASPPLSSEELPPLPELPSLPPLPAEAPTAAPMSVPAEATMASLGGDLPKGAAPTMVPPPRGASLLPDSQATMDAFTRPESELATQAESGEMAVIAPGALVASRYRVEHMLGQGGMGAVYSALDLELAEQVALKVLNQPSQSSSQLARFRQELKLTRRLAHPNIVRVHDLGVHGGQRFITMELLEGTELRQLIEKGMELADTQHCMLQVAAGLDAAHAEGVVHRDIKPENLFITTEGVVKVMDFGIARSTAGDSVTRTGAMGGTLAYMSPEQAMDFSSVCAASDQYSLGVVAYEALTGQRPFQHRAIGQLLQMHANDPPRPLRELRSDLPQFVEEAVLRALAKRPEQRFPSCTAFARALAGS